MVVVKPVFLLGANARNACENCSLLHSINLGTDFLSHTIIAAFHKELGICESRGYFSFWHKKSSELEVSIYSNPVNLLRKLLIFSLN